MNKQPCIVQSRQEAILLIGEFYKNNSSTDNLPDMIMQDLLIDRLERLGEMEVFLNGHALHLLKSEIYTVAE